MEFSIFVALSIFVLVVSAYKISYKEKCHSRPLSWFSLFASFLVTQIGSSSLLYTAELAYCDGIYAVLYPLGTSIGVLALGLGIGAKLHQLQLADVSDVFQKHYQSETLKKASSFLLFAALLGLLIAQAMALKALLRTIGVERELFFIAVWMSIVFFSLKKNLGTTTSVEILQAVLILGILVAAYFFSPQSTASHLTFFSEIEDDVFEGVNGKLSSYLLMPCFFVFFEPELIQNIPLAPSKRKILSAALFSGMILLIVSLVPAYCGLTGKSIPSVANAENSMLAMSCTCILLFAFAYRSSSLLRSITVRIKEAFTPPEISQSLFSPYPSGSARRWTFVFGVVALIASYTERAIPDLIFTSYELVVVSLFVPLVKAAFSCCPTKISKEGATLSMLFGASSFCLCHLFSVTFFPEMLSLALSWIGFLAGEAISKRKQSLLLS